MTFSAAGWKRGDQLPVDVTMPVRFAGALNPACRDVGTLARNLQINAINNLRTQPDVSARPNDLSKRTQAIVQISDRPSIIAPFGEIEVESATLTGLIRWTEPPLDTIYKILTPLAGGPPLAGCAISDMPGFGLFGLMLSIDRKLSFISIPVSERNRKKIYRRPITQEPSSSVTVTS